MKLNKDNTNFTHSCAAFKMKTLILTILFSIPVIGQGQDLVSVVKDTTTGPIDFCDQDTPDSLVIGQQAKIRHNGGIYTDLNKTDWGGWPSKKIKRQAGENAWGKFYPETGDTGVVVHRTVYSEDGVASARRIYILLINGHYVPIGCGYLTNPNQPDDNELLRQSWQEVEEYGAGNCKFRKYGINDCWKRVGIFTIDKMAETFACDLRANNIDTILLCKSIGDNGSSPYEKEYILWTDKGKGYLKTFENNKQHDPTETETKEYDWTEITDFFFDNSVDTITIEPKSIVSHWKNYIIQFWYGDHFYCFGMQLLCPEEDEKLLNVRMVRLLEEKLEINE